MRKTKEDAEITREKLLDAGLKVFSKKGYVSTTLDDIAREAGVTRGAVYWHFKNGKPELFEALINERSRGAQEIANAIVAEGGTPLHMLERILVRMMEYLEEDDDFRAVQELTILRTEVVPELEHSMREKFQLQRQSIDSFADLIRQGQEAGEIRPDVDPEIAAIAAIGLMDGVIVMWMMDRSLFSIKAIARPVVETFLKGMMEQGTSFKLILGRNAKKR
jgi:TetR/AcrR family acrAB operon transcriptional repressor